MVDALTYSLHWLDYVVFALMMITTVGIGILFATTGDKQRTTNEYFTANQGLGVIPATLSIVVSYMSAIAIVGVPAEAYLYGGEYIWAVLGTSIATTVAALFVVPVMYRLKLVSINKVGLHVHVLQFGTCNHFPTDFGFSITDCLCCVISGTDVVNCINCCIIRILQCQDHRFRMSS